MTLARAVADITPIPLGLVDDRPRAAAARAFGDAFGRTGFAVVADHGIDDALIDRALAATRALFALPEAVKRRYVVAGGGGQRGLTPFRVETAKGAALPDLKEFWHVGRDLAARRPAGRGDAGQPVARRGARLPPGGHRALSPRSTPPAAGCCARSPSTSASHADFFAGPTTDGNSILRLLHYPPVDGTPAAVRAGAHEDINVITLLLGADEAGLQLLTRDRRVARHRRPAGDARLQHRRHARAADRRAAAVDDAPGGQSVARARPPRALLDALLPALPAGL